MTFVRGFHHAPVLFMKPEHPLFRKIDWNEIANGKYAVVDPMDSTEIMYLTDQAYQMQVRVSMRADTKLIVLCRAGDRKPVPSTVSDQATLEEDLPPSSSNKKSPISQETRIRRIQKLFQWLQDPLPIMSIDLSPGEDAIIAISPETLENLIRSLGITTYHRLGGSLSRNRVLEENLLELGRRLSKIYLRDGSLGVVQYMKNTLFYIQRWLACKTAKRDSWLLGTPVPLSRAGLPKVLPHYFRRAIQREDIMLIRVIGTVLKAYSVLDGKHEVQKLETVLSPHPAIGFGSDEINPDVLGEFRHFVQTEFWNIFRKILDGSKSYNALMNPTLTYREGAQPFFPQSAGPNGPVAYMAAPLDVEAWDILTEDVTKSPIIRWLEHVEDNRTLTLFNNILARLRELGTQCVDSRSLGKLVLKEEAAGKVRTIAMVDYWTQRAMKPVHDWLMSLLDLLPGDSTFKQEEALATFAQKYGDRTVWSIDLKAATDLIPCVLYETVLEGILDPLTVRLWKELLQDREFDLPSSKLVCNDLRKKMGGTGIRYSRGLPMGAMTHWASMALTHHALVLFSAHRAGELYEGFDEYRVLGDDVVIANKSTAEQYMLVTTALQVPTSLAKTLTGRLFIFASQAMMGEINLSPLSTKEELKSSSMGRRVELALRAVRRGWLQHCNNSVNGFLRLLLPREYYIRCNRNLSRSGTLTGPARLALATAFLLGGSKLDALLQRKTGVSYALLPLMGSVQALARSVELPLINIVNKLRLTLVEVESILVIRFLKSILRQLDSAIIEYKTQVTALCVALDNVLKAGFFGSTSNLVLLKFTSYLRDGYFEQLPPAKGKVLGTWERSVYPTVGTKGLRIFAKLFPGRELQAFAYCYAEASKWAWSSSGKLAVEVHGYRHHEPFLEQGLFYIILDHFGEIPITIGTKSYPKGDDSYDELGAESYGTIGELFSPKGLMGGPPGASIFKSTSKYWSPVRAFMHGAPRWVPFIEMGSDKLLKFKREITRDLDLMVRGTHPKQGSLWDVREILEVWERKLLEIPRIPSFTNRLLLARPMETQVSSLLQQWTTVGDPFVRLSILAGTALRVIPSSQGPIGPDPETWRMEGLGRLAVKAIRFAFFDGYYAASAAFSRLARPGLRGRC